MAKISREALADDVQLGTDDPGGPVEVRRLPDGRSVLLPRSPSGRRLNSDALDVLADVQRVVRDIEQLKTELDQLVEESREAGAPWALIGFSVGMSGQAAQKRWTDA